MPKSLSTSSMVCGTKDKKSHSRKCKEPCQSSSSSSCCSEQCLDCCTSQYQRLNRFASFVATEQLLHAGETGANVYGVAANTNATTSSDSDAIFNRSGALIPPPNTTGGTAANPGAYANEVGCSASGDLNLPTDLDQNGYSVAYAAYWFVNEFSYGPYEPGCHNDQVYGWFVNLQSGELQLFTMIDGVPTNATRACLSADTSTLSSAQKKQLKLLNKLFKLSKSAVKEVNGIPSNEGNIVEVCDCKGDKWLLYVNTADNQNGSPLSTSNYEFAVVATKLC